MVFQSIDGIRFKMGAEFDFGFLKKYGCVFKVFDDQDSGNICFGIDSGSERLFVKFAGAPTAEYRGSPEDAAARLKATLPVYRDIRHEALIRFIAAEETGGGYAMIFAWAEGRCMARMYPEDHRRIMLLPNAEKLGIFRTVISFMQTVADCGYAAVDFYDGSIMYDEKARKTTICDIDFFQKRPFRNNMGRMWGSERFMSPEEYAYGADIDEVTNVFTLGQTAFSLFTDSDRDPARWPLSKDSYAVLLRATEPARERRHPSIAEFKRAWEAANPASQDPKTAWDEEMTRCLTVQRQRYPLMNEEDTVKFAFQGMLGVGHLIRSESEALARLRAEMDGLEPDGDEPLTEKLSPDWLRLNLRAAMARGMSAEAIASALCRSARERPDFTRQDVYGFCTRLDGSEAMRKAAGKILDEHRLPGHSERYRESFHPAYRVLHRKYAPSADPFTARPSAAEARSPRTESSVPASHAVHAEAHLSDEWAFFRVHTEDAAYLTGQPRGLFAAVGKLSDAGLLTEDEEKDYRRNRAYFENILPVPPFYAQGNPDGAVTWFRNTVESRRIFHQMSFYRRMAQKYGKRLFLSKCRTAPGELIYEDAFQIAAKAPKADAEVTVRELGWPIREIREGDIAQCVDVIRESFLTVAAQFGITEENAPRFTAFATNEQRIRWHLYEERRPMYGYFVGEKLIGCYSLKAQEKGECELNNLCVLPAFRHREIGEELLFDAFAKAREMKCVKMNIGIVEENRVLRAWYESFGFAHTGTKTFPFFPFTCGYMEKALE